jgi:integrase
MNDWYRSWDALRKSAGLPDIRYYDLRHTAITDLLGNASIPERVVIEIAGHVSNKMLNRYSHQRKAEKQSALNALDKLSEKIAEPKPQAANSTLSLTRWSISPKSDDDEKAG